MYIGIWNRVLMVKGKYFRALNYFE